MLYSVFVGRLAQTVKKDDLYDLFKGCGTVMDVFICDEPDRSNNNYGFIRFSTVEGCLKAVEDLNTWSLHGNRIIVDIAKDTVGRIKTDHKVNTDKIVKPVAPPPRPHIKSDDGDKSSDMVQDIMYLSRIKETCATLNCQVKSGSLGDEKSKPVDIDKLLDKVASTPLDRVKPVKGVFNKDITPEQIKQKLTDSDRKSMDMNNSKANAYLAALQTVVGTMNSFLKEGKKEPELHVPCENLNSSMNNTLSDSNPGIASDSGEENVDSLHYKSDTLSADEDKELLVGHNVVSSGDEETREQNVESLVKESEASHTYQSIGSSAEESEARQIEQTSLDNTMKRNLVNDRMRSIAERMKENLQGLSMGSSHGTVKHGNEKSSDEHKNEIENEPTKEKTNFDVFLPSSQDTESSVNKKTKSSDLSVLERFKSLQRNPSTEIEENSYSDSDVEGPSGDSGIESDAISAKQQKRVSDQLQTEVPVTDNDPLCYSSFSESSVGKTDKMDDCAIIQNFLQKALKIGPGEGEKETVEAVPGEQKTSPVSAMGRGRGILSFIKK